MIRSPAQSDFVVTRPAPPPVVELPSEAEAVALPRAQLKSSEPSDLATRWVMRVTFFVLFLLVVLCMVGPHIPSGE